jgi:uncharacterized HAD superfamily protein
MVKFQHLQLVKLHFAKNYCLRTRRWYIFGEKSLKSKIYYALMKMVMVILISSAWSTFKTNQIIFDIYAGATGRNIPKHAGRKGDDRPILIFSLMKHIYYLMKEQSSLLDQMKPL